MINIKYSSNRRKAKWSVTINNQIIKLEISTYSCNSLSCCRSYKVSDSIWSDLLWLFSMKWICTVIKLKEILNRRKEDFFERKCHQIIRATYFPHIFIKTTTEPVHAWAAVHNRPVPTLPTLYIFSTWTCLKLKRGLRRGGWVQCHELEKKKHDRIYTSFTWPWPRN